MPIKDGNREPFGQTPEDWTDTHYEVYAQALADVMYVLGANDGGGKGYDPLTLDTENKMAYTYVFDLWDGGREHPYESLKQLRHGMLKETCVRIEGSLARSSVALWINKQRLEQFKR